MWSVTFTDTDQGAWKCLCHRRWVWRKFGLG